MKKAGMPVVVAKLSEREIAARVRENAKRTLGRFTKKELDDFVIALQKKRQESAKKGKRVGIEQLQSVFLPYSEDIVSLRKKYKSKPSVCLGESRKKCPSKFGRVRCENKLKRYPSLFKKTHFLCPKCGWSNRETLEQIEQREKLLDVKM